MYRLTIQLAILSALTLTNALQLPDLQAFVTAIPLLDSYAISNATHQELLKRQQQTNCPASYSNCANLGAPGLCCATTAVCSADALGHVACCRSGVVCSGTIGGIITGGTLDGNGNLVGGGAVATATATNAGVSASNGYVGATTTTTTLAAATTTANGFIIASNAIVAQPGAASRPDIPVVALLIVGVLDALRLW